MQPVTAGILAALLCAGLRAGIHDTVYYSALNGRHVPIKVYTPPGYEQTGYRYPVVYNLHGGGGSPDRQWERTRVTLEAAMRNQAVRPMIYVYANGLGGDTLFLDLADGSLKAAGTIIYELIPFIDANYRTIASHEGRAIEGFSMGGFGALQLAFKYPFLFSSVVSYGGAVLSPDSARIGEENSRFPDRAFFDANSPWGLAERNAEQIREHLRVRMVCGEDDEKWFAGNLMLRERLEGFKIPVSWAPVAGVAHDTRGLYERVGLESLRFLEAGFRDLWTPVEGVIQDLYFWSELHRRNVWIKVYTPPDYDRTDRRYPVVYNLHGAGGGTPQRQWVRTRVTLKDAFENRKLSPVIYVFVNGLGDTFYLDFQDGSVKAESMVVHELIPFVERRFRAVASRHGRAIEGFSMGGAGALRLALKYPELFSSVVSYGAALVRGDRFREGEARFGSGELFDRNSPWTLAGENASRVRGALRIRMVCGDQDRLYPLNVEFRDLLLKLRIPVDWVPIAGVGHDTTRLYRRVGLESLEFMQRGFTAAR